MRSNGARLRMGALAVLAIVCAVLARRAVVAGDGPEYHLMLESLYRHASPDRRPHDVEIVLQNLAAHGYGVDWQHGFYPTERGVWYSYHFFAYPFAALPVKALLDALGIDAFGALAWTNALLVFVASVYALRRLTPTRVVFTLLAVVSPVLTYVPWAHAEAFVWASVVASLVALDDDRPDLAALFAALGSLQAPPVVVLVVFAGVRALRSRGPRRRRALLVTRTIACGAISVVAPAFYLIKFGTPSLIAASGWSDTTLVSSSRVASLALDLDQGMLAYVPATLGLGVVALALGRLRAAPYALAALAMMALSASTTNFNAGCAGMNRYDVWIAPILAWIAARESGPRLAASRPHARLAWRAAVSAGVAAQLAIVLVTPEGDDAGTHNAVARLALAYAPSPYAPDPVHRPTRHVRARFATARARSASRSWTPPYASDDDPRFRDLSRSFTAADRENPITRFREKRQ